MRGASYPPPTGDVAVGDRVQVQRVRLEGDDEEEDDEGYEDVDEDDAGGENLED